MKNYNQDRSARSYRGGSGGGGGRRKGKQRFGNGQRRANNSNERKFPKFADDDYNNKYEDHTEQWSQNDWQYKKNNNYNKSDRYRNNDIDNGILPWHRKAPIVPLVIPPQPSTNFKQDEVVSDKNYTANEQIADNDMPANADISISPEEKNISETFFSRSRNDSVSTNNTKVNSTDFSQSPVKHTVEIKPVKLEKIKQERKSSSSSSSESSSSESSSNEEVPEQHQKTLTPIVKESPATSLPLKNTLKKKSNVNENLASAAKRKTPPISSSSSSSSSSEEEVEQTKLSPMTRPSKSAIKAIQTELQKQETKTKTKTSKKKCEAEDDVIVVGNLENKIVLEDDSDEEEIPSNKKSRNTTKKAEQCVICDKKGHTSFQCQMICKNCIAPYHGYRTCPHPANLNTMWQLFLEFCMQQFQQFTAIKDVHINHNDSVPKAKVDLPSTHTANRTNKNKKKQSKTSDTKTKSAKKRKISESTKKKILKEDNTDDEDTANTSSSETEEGTTESDNSTSSGSLVASKKRLRLKNKSSTESPFNRPTFTPNPVNLPLVLNRFPNLTSATAAVTDPNTSNNALNTLLLTQMFQNAIGSLK